MFENTHPSLLTTLISQITVRKGARIGIQSIGRFEVGNVSVTNFLATTSSVFGGASFVSPTISANILQDSLWFEVFSTNGNPYQVFVRTSSLQITAAVTVCAASAQAPGDNVYGAHASVTLVGLSSTFPVAVTWTQTMAGSDGRCMWVSMVGQLSVDATDANVQSGLSLSFSSIIVKLQTACDTSSVICPAGSAVPVVFPTSSITTLSLLDNSPRRTLQFVTLLDVLPPSFVGCPSNLRYMLTANTYNDSAVASWAEPFAIDNVAIAKLTGPLATVQQGAGVSLLITPKQSPLSVTYTATDTANLKTVCTLNISVDFARVPFSTAATLNARVTQASRLSRRRRTLYQLATAQLDLGTPSFTMSASQFNELEVTLNAPAGQRIVVAPVAELAPPVSLNVRVLFTSTNCASASELPEGDEFTSVTLVDLQDMQGNALPPVTGWFATHPSSAMVPSSGYIFLGGQGSLFSNGFSFAALTLVLAYPRGRRNNATACSDTYQLDPANSFVSFSYIFPPTATIPASLMSLRDITPPHWSNCPSDIVTDLEASARPDTTLQVFWSEPSASDNTAVQGSNRSFAPGMFFGLTPPGQGHIVKYTAWDAAGNIGVCSFTVRINDITAPLATCPTSLQLPFVNSTALLSQFGLPLTDVTDNSAVLLLNVTLFQQVQAVTTQWTAQYVFDNATSAFDLASSTLPATVTVDPYPYGVSLLLTDSSGNVKQCDYTINFIDTIIPQFPSCPSQIPVATTSNGRVNFTWTVPDATDNDQVQATSTINATSATMQQGLYQVTLVQGQSVLVPVTFRALDRVGNAATCNSTIVVTGPSTATAVDGGSSSDSSSMLPVVAGAIGGVALLVIIVAVVLTRRRARAKPVDYTATLQRLADIMALQTAKPTTPRELKREHIKIISNLGKGQFGTVDKAIIDEKVGSVPGYLCAVKQLLTSDAHGLASLMEESAIMAQLDSEFCVRLIGVVTIGSPMMMVLEYCEHGALNRYLEKSAGTLTESFRLTIAGDCSEGLSYLTKRGFIHRDVAARNVLLSSELRGKISDYGMSREAEETEYYQSRGGALPVRWSAPEVLEKRKFSAKSDVYALGILLYEIWTDGATPYGEWTNQRVWVEVVHGYRLPQPSLCAADVHVMMVDCWWEDPLDRVELKELVTFFRNKTGGVVGINPAESPELQWTGGDNSLYHNQSGDMDGVGRTAVAGAHNGAMYDTGDDAPVSEAHGARTIALYDTGDEVNGPVGGRTTPSTTGRAVGPSTRASPPKQARGGKDTNPHSIYDMGDDVNNGAAGMVTAAAGRTAALKMHSGTSGNIVRNGNGRGSNIYDMGDNGGIAAVLASLGPSSTLTSVTSTVENPMFDEADEADKGMEGVLMETHLARSSTGDGYLQVETDLGVVFSC